MVFELELCKLPLKICAGSQNQVKYFQFQIVKVVNFKMAIVLMSQTAFDEFVAQYFQFRICA